MTFLDRDPSESRAPGFWPTLDIAIISILSRAIICGCRSGSPTITHEAQRVIHGESFVTVPR
jgi:hypothetical protein